MRKKRLRTMAQFEDGDKLQVLKDRLTVSGPDMTSFRQVLHSIGQQSNQTGSRPNQGPQPQQQPQTVEANSAKAAQTGPAQVHNKLPQRPNSRDVLPPAAPTSTQPPFSFGAASPDGKPLYAATPQLTQDNLTLPRKKIKTGVQTSSPAGGSQTASPQTKTLSPELRKQVEPKPAPAKPTFPCTVPDCEMGAPPFSSDALRKKHIEEFHRQPFQEPAQFLEQAIVDNWNQISQTNPAATSAQAGTAGGLASQDGRSADKPGAAPGGPDGNTAAVDLQQPHTIEKSGLATGTIDPQTLFAPAYNFDPIAGGVISNTSLYRSATPNEDTPESSKDSGTSEPNSDIAEASSLDIDIDLAAFNYDSLYLDSPGTYDHGDDEGNYAANMIAHIASEHSYEIPQHIDMSLYSMDC